MKAIHIICHAKGAGHKNLWELTADPKTYRSACWALSASEVQELVGGWLFLHEAKKKPSYLGGVIQRLETCDRPRKATDKGIAFFFEERPEGAGCPWNWSRSTGNPYEWHSGVVETERATAPRI